MINKTVVSYQGYTEIVSKEWFSLTVNIFFNQLFRIFVNISRKSTFPLEEVTQREKDE
jgi:hypothetical protein